MCYLYARNINWGISLFILQRSCHFWFCVHYITYKVIGFFLNKSIKLVAAAVELLLFLRLLHTSTLLLLSFRHFELLNSERAKATFENTTVKSGSCLADEISSEQLYLRNVEDFTTA